MNEISLKPAASFSSLTHAGVFLFLLLAIFTIYGQVSDFNFITLDDDVFVTKNERVLHGITGDNIKWAFGFQDQETYWHPLTWLSHMLDVEFYGTDAGLHHVTNVILHLCNAFLLYLFLVQSTGAFWRSCLVAVIFAIHPLNVESVAWISERKNTLSTFFCFLTLLCYVRYAKKPRYFGWFLTLSVFTAGLLAKPMLITLPCVLFLLDYWPLGRFRLKKSIKKGDGKLPAFPNCQIQKTRFLIVEKIPFFLFALAAAYLTQHSFAKITMNISLQTVPLSIRLSNAVVSYLKYAGKMLYPINLAVFYPLPDSVSLWATAGAFIWLVCLSVLIVYKSPRHPYLFTGWFWYLGTLVPVLGVVQAGLWPAMADRWAYIPMVGLLIVIVWGIADLFEQRKIRLPVVIILAGFAIITLTGISKKQASYWQNSVKLFRHALDVGVRHPVIHLNLGAGYAAMNRPQEAIEQYLLALNDYKYKQQNNPLLKKLYSYLGIEMARINKPQESIGYFLKALSITPDYADYINIGRIFSEQKMLPQAANAYKEALKLRPQSVAALNNLGLIYTEQKQFSSAIAVFKQAIDQNKYYIKSYNNLGLALCSQGEADKAIEEFRQALAIDPDYQKAKINLRLALSGRCKAVITASEKQ